MASCAERAHECAFSLARGVRLGVIESASGGRCFGVVLAGLEKLVNERLWIAVVGQVPGLPILIVAPGSVELAVQETDRADTQLGEGRTRTLRWLGRGQHAEKRHCDTLCG